MPMNRFGPLEPDLLVALDEEVCGPPDPRLWDHVNDHAFAFMADGEATLERLDEGVYVVRPSRTLFPGLLLSDEEESLGTCLPRSRSERITARAHRLENDAPPRRELAGTAGFCPDAVPIAYLTKSLPMESRRVGMSARGGRVGLSTTTVLTEAGGVHTLIIDGESRTFLRPTHYPYTAVCKLELWTRPAPRGALTKTSTYATGFLVGRRTLMTSGHAFDNSSIASGLAAIKVIPACWANQPVFGPGFVTWVRRRRRWHSDSGNDLQLCQLFDPVGDQLGYLGLQEYDSDWQDRSVWTMAGFPFDRSMFGMSVQHGIAVRDDDDGDDIRLDGVTYDSTQVENDADEASGASGSPLMAVFSRGDVRAIGVHSGYEKDWVSGSYETWSCAAGGKALVAIGRWGRAHWD